MQNNIQSLSERYRDASSLELVKLAVQKEFTGRIALVSSFGADAAILLHMVSTIDPSTPVLFLDTQKLFAETLGYRDALSARLGLTDVRSVKPLPENEAGLDPKGVLWASEPNRCCYFRKVLPLQRALEGFDAWITGRKHFQNSQRAELPTFELADGRVKINPLLGWSAEDVADYFKKHDLPAHPLVAKGYPSIGCQPCTEPVKPGEDPRAGRWRGQDKTECGIHFGPNGQITRANPVREPRTMGCG